MKKLISVGILGLLLIIGNISATCLTLNDNSEKSIIPPPEPPVTSIFYNPETGMVHLIAADYPIHDSSGVKATYYKIDDGEQQTYTGPFFIGEGTHTVEYWSVDNVDNEEYHKQATFTFDSTPPTVEIIKPALGQIYLFDKYVFNGRITRPSCIGKLNISVNADDGDGTGVNTVYFSYANETGFDNDGSDGWTDTNSESYFGEITIVVIAIDNKGLMSEPVKRKVGVFSLGLI